MYLSYGLNFPQIFVNVSRHNHSIFWSTMSLQCLSIFFWKFEFNYFRWTARPSIISRWQTSAGETRSVTTWTSSDKLSGSRFPDSEHVLNIHLKRNTKIHWNIAFHFRDLWSSAGPTTTTSPWQPSPGSASSWRVSRSEYFFSNCSNVLVTCSWIMVSNFLDPTSAVSLSGPSSILAGDVATFTCVSHNVSGHSTFRWDQGVTRSTNNFYTINLCPLLLFSSDDWSSRKSNVRPSVQLKFV